MSWFRRHPLAVAYALIVAVGAFALWGVQHEAEVRRRDLCETVNDQQALVERLVDVALQDTGGGGLPLTKLPEFEALDAETKAYFVALEGLLAASDSDDPRSLEGRLREFADSLNPADCTRG